MGEITSLTKVLPSLIRLKITSQKQQTLSEFIIYQSTYIKLSWPLYLLTCKLSNYLNTFICLFYIVQRFYKKKKKSNLFPVEDHPQLIELGTSIRLCFVYIGNHHTLKFCHVWRHLLASILTDKGLSS